MLLPVVTFNYFWVCDKLLHLPAAGSWSPHSRKWRFHQTLLPSCLTKSRNCGLCLDRRAICTIGNSVWMISILLNWPSFIPINGSALAFSQIREAEINQISPCCVQTGREPDSGSGIQFEIFRIPFIHIVAFPATNVPNSKIWVGSCWDRSAATQTHSTSRRNAVHSKLPRVSRLQGLCPRHRQRRGKRVRSGGCGDPHPEEAASAWPESQWLTV